MGENGRHPAHNMSDSTGRIPAFFWQNNAELSFFWNVTGTGHFAGFFVGAENQKRESEPA